MATGTQVSCINKTNRMDPHDRIHSIGGRLADGRPWKMSQPDAIAAISAGRERFWVSAGGASVWVIVAQHNGRSYLKTQNDGLQPDNLLSLPECP